MEQIVTKAKKEFEYILNYVRKDAQNQQLAEVEKGIFYALLKLGMTLLVIFLQQKGTGYMGKIHTDKEDTKRPYHSKKCKTYLSIFGKVSIPRACYWQKEAHEIYPLDAELNLPSTEYSYILQEWGTGLGSEQAYEKAAKFLENILGIPLWGSAIETVMQKASVDVPNFYELRQNPDAKSEKELLVVTMDGKGVVMKKNQLEQKISRKRPRKMKKLGEQEKKRKTKHKDEMKPGKKKMSTVIGAYTIAPHERTAEDFLAKKKGHNRPNPCNKIIQATLEGKEAAVRRLTKEVDKRDPNKKKPSVALVDGEHKLRSLLKVHLPWFVIIIDIYHVMEYLWDGAHVFFKKKSIEAQSWMTDKLTKILHGKVQEIIAELKGVLSTISKGKQKQLHRIITYLENGKAHMRYDTYLKQGYPIGSGVVEGACKNLVKDRMEQSGMQWTIVGAEAILGMRSIQINGMAHEYWQYHMAQERKKLYGTCMEEMAA